MKAIRQAWEVHKAEEAGRRRDEDRLLKEGQAAARARSAAPSTANQSGGTASRGAAAAALGSGKQAQPSSRC